MTRSEFDSFNWSKTCNSQLTLRGLALDTRVNLDDKIPIFTVQSNSFPGGDNSDYINHINRTRSFKIWRSLSIQVCGLWKQPFKFILHNAYLFGWLGQRLILASWQR